MINTTHSHAGGFAAGSLIHTQDGLKPIEQIQVDDRVLSQPERGGEKAYKRVTQTFRINDESVYSVDYYEKDAWDRAINEGILIDYADHSRIIVTANHSFWVKDKGWAGVCDLESHDQIQLEDGRLGLINQIRTLYRSNRSATAWEPNSSSPWCDLGKLIDLSNNQSGEFNFKGPQWERDFDTEDMLNPDFYYRTTVYHFEVEYFHTYYVGTKGVWVHDSAASC